MPEYRQDPLSRRWVIIAEDRAGRPTEFLTQLPRQPLERCPFCAGNEFDTPDAIALYPQEPSHAGTWKVRVIPNKYPAVVSRPGTATGDSRPHEVSPTNPRGDIAIPGVGIHEVIIESPHHVASLTELPIEQAQLTLRAYQDRLLSLGQDSRLNYGALFKNCRGGSGATLEHIHSQLLATSIVPTDVSDELDAATQHCDQTRQCFFCQLAQEELANRVRMVTDSGKLIAFCPFASRFPYETWILPKAHSSRFELADSATLTELSGVLQDVLRAFERLGVEVAYNYWIRTAPFRASCEQAYHWRIEMIPRVTTQGGYEWGSGCYVNPISPESAASWLREGRWQENVTGKKM